MSVARRYGLTPLGEELLAAVAGGQIPVVPDRRRVQAPPCPACGHRTFVLAAGRGRRKCADFGCACRCAEFFA